MSKAIRLCLALAIFGAALVLADEGKCMAPPPDQTTPPTSCGGSDLQSKPESELTAKEKKILSVYAQKKSSLELMNFMPKENFWSNPWYHISPGKNIPESVTALIEIPKGSRAKFEVDSDSGLIRLDRILYNAIHYPSHYGYIPSTMTGDRDPLDILVLCSESVPPLTLIEARVIGIIQMIDGDEEDDKIIAVAKGDPKYAHVKDINDVSRHTILEIEHFFEDYKRRIGIEVILEEFQGKEQAYEVIHQSLDYYKALKQNREASKSSAK